MKQMCPDLLVYDFCSISHTHLRDAVIGQCGNFTIRDTGGVLARKSQENLSGHEVHPPSSFPLLPMLGSSPVSPSMPGPVQAAQAAPALQSTRLQPQLFVAGTWGAAAAQQWAALGSPVWVIPCICCLLFLPFCACQVSQDSTAGNSLEGLSCCFGLGFFKVLIFCSSQMKFRIVSKSWHKCEGKALWYWQKVAVP